MSLLLPLGLLGLLSIVVLIIIYLLKPNYQQKIVSSTLIWKLSLKYKRKRIPISKLRNILLIICQILALVACALILARPAIVAEVPTVYTEKIAIIDASANMLTQTDGETRFERAVKQVKELTKELMESDGVITIILADSKASYVVQRSKQDSAEEIYQKLDALECSYGQADVDGAMELAGNVLDANNDVEVLFYTATEYVDTGKIEVIDVSKSDEWNAAILGCSAVLEENYYSFSVDVACYGRDTDIMLYAVVNGVNDSTDVRNLRLPVRCEGDAVQTVIMGAEEGIYSYDSVYLYLEETDSLAIDNSFFLYGGTKQPIKVVYYSSRPNNFFSGALMAAQQVLRERWNIILDLTPKATVLEGYDFYIFEHYMPSTLPTDGVVLLADPDKVPEGAGFSLGDIVRGDFTLAPGITHPITAGIDAHEMTVTAYTRVVSNDGFDSLIYCGGDPVLLVKNEPDVKIAVMAFSLNSANFAVLDFPLIMLHIFDFFLPSTVTQYVYDVNDTASFNARGPVLTVTANNLETTFETFPGTLTLTAPGVYTLTQTLLSGTNVTENFYVKIAGSESNIFRQEYTLVNPYYDPTPKVEDLDLLLYFAAALVALLFAEWLLQSLEHM